MSEYSWCDVVQAIAAVVSLVPIMIGGMVALVKWLKDQHVSHLQFLEELANKRHQDDVANLFSYLETDVESFKECSPQYRKSVVDTLTFLSGVCSLLRTGKISKKEFAPYEVDIRCLFQNDAFRAYVSGMLYQDGEPTAKSKLAPLMNIIDEMGLTINLESISSDPDDECVSSERFCGSSSQLDGAGDLKKEDFKKPTAIIKINRLYKEGMSSAEILAVTCGWWRLNLEAAKRIQLVLSVANGIVKGVYVVREWFLDPDGSNRVGFSGYDAEDAILKKFIGKSVRQLFPRGAANPVRYFL